MQQRMICDTQSALGMKLNEEFVMISLTSGKFYHFNEASEAFLSFFHTPGSLDEYVEVYSAGEAEKKHLTEFCEFLLSEKLLQPVTEETDAGQAERKLSGPYARPAFVRHGDKNLDEFEFSYP